MSTWRTCSKMVWTSPWRPPNNPIAEAVVSGPSEITCFRNQAFDVSQTGTCPNLFVPWFGDIIQVLFSRNLPVKRHGHLLSAHVELTSVHLGCAQVQTGPDQITPNPLPCALKVGNPTIIRRRLVIILCAQAIHEALHNMIQHVYHQDNLFTSGFGCSKHQILWHGPLIRMIFHILFLEVTMQGLRRRLKNWPTGLLCDILIHVMTFI